MTGKHIRELFEAAPFRPFELVLANQERVRVEHSEWTALSSTGRIITLERPDHSTLIVDLLLVLAIEVLPFRDEADIWVDGAPPVG